MSSKIDVTGATYICHKQKLDAEMSECWDLKDLLKSVKTATNRGFKYF